MKRLSCYLTALFLITTTALFAQDSASLFQWSVSSRKLGGGKYELIFSTPGRSGWQLYAPGQDLEGVATAEVQFADSAFIVSKTFKDSGTIKTVQSTLFNRPLKMDLAAARWSTIVTLGDTIPASIQGTLLYTYGRGDEFYPATAHNFSVALEGGVSAGLSILRTTIDINHPVSSCGDEIKSQSLWHLFLIGAGAGLLSLLLPCIFPLIPLTVSFFTKQSGSRRKGVINAFWYGFSIFLIFILLSLPFHLFNIQPEVLNNISTNVALNLTFFVFFIAFALSFFGYYEIVLPSALANKVDARSGAGDLAGIFFMALTLVIVSFSCTGPILGTLLVSAFTSQNGAWQLSAGMAGFGIGLGLPFLLFALFPGWLQSLPKSGGWMNEVKVVFGFIELAMAAKFLSQADLVKQWGLFPREIFVGVWVIIGICIVLYLAGIIRFSHDSKPKITRPRMVFIALFTVVTLYLLPGVTNTPWARLRLISGFPPPVG